MPRDGHVTAVLGNELHKSLSETRVLIVGAGGIGCELVKNVVLSGFRDITLLDLDTIDLSNLNRQFLFRQKDVKSPKALVAAQTASMFNPGAKILPICGNIKDSQYDLTWFKAFHVVMNALDNIGEQIFHFLALPGLEAQWLDARRHVNRMCIAAGIPLIESGTAGYLGQVQPLMKEKTECFDCIPKPTPKSFPVCTIRSTPSTPIHCIVWAKSYLFPQLFGEIEEDTSELDAALAAGENATEIAQLREEVASFQTVRSTIVSSGAVDNAAKLAFDKVFRQDIERLLAMHDMWKHRRPPVALDHDAILTDTAGSSIGVTHRDDLQLNSGITTLKDQRQLSLLDNVKLFDRSLWNLAQRLRAGQHRTALSFDKDDDDSLDFVTATANLRAWAYGIPTLTRWQVKEMAGNIIPAIATTNAIIAGLVVLQAFHLLRAFPVNPPVIQGPPRTPQGLSGHAYGSEPFAARNVFIQSGRPASPLGAFVTMSPNPQCAVCRDTYLAVPCDVDRVTLGELVNALLDAEASSWGEEPREVSVFEEGRVLSEPDWTDNHTRSLADLNCGYGKFVTLVDEEEKLGNVVLAISRFPPNHSTKEVNFILPPCTLPPPRQGLPPPLPSPVFSPVKPISSPSKSTTIKRSASDVNGDGAQAVHSAKKFKTHHANDFSDGEIEVLEPMSSDRRHHATVEDRILEDEGLLLVDEPMDF
ncbi:uncharacterized protein EI90DRAFT_3133713 [Cantharellus anzutake]|uniref:uncharacterized protein n=1 Tax=Cantharellus anzutake TaxID=1750568 RepID=UPI0019075AA9|nr:uncharacterized protein EI90DRAFT_3133713 [Cantharellus anzutake]KAF8317744.1 hypothetical protein EI90DRAFT_3133713 [Cantharellus anzutake]